MMKRMIKRAVQEAGKTSQQGFSLIEVLVVLAIIGVLAAIAIPVYMGIRERAANGACLADVRAYATAVYATHYDQEAESTPSVASVLATYPDDGACTSIAVNGDTLEGTPRAPGDAEALQVVALGFAPAESG